MNKTLIIGMGSSPKNIDIQCAVSMYYDYESNKYELLDFYKSKEVKELFESFILPSIEKNNIESHVTFKSSKVKDFFSNEYSSLLFASEPCVMFHSLQDSKDYIFEPSETYQVLGDSLTYGIIDATSLNKTKKELLDTSLKDIDDVLTQALLVATAKTYSAGFWSGNL
jgi:hypothetical protein